MVRIKIFILIFLLFYYCEERIKTIKEVVFPEGPMIVESVMCTDIINGNPYGITEEFFKGDTVNLWILWMGIRENSKITCFWSKPDGNLFAKDSIVIERDTGKMITIFSVLTDNSSPSGEWMVEIYLNQDFLRSHLFYLLEQNKKGDLNHLFFKIIPCILNYN
jgi:hypothetical protein